MKLSPSQMKIVRHQFDSLCRKVLREESRNIDKQLARRAEKEISFSGLSEQELGRLYAMDDYPSDSTYFDVLDYHRKMGALRQVSTLPYRKSDGKNSFLYRHLVRILWSETDRWDQIGSPHRACGSYGGIIPPKAAAR